MAGCRNVVTTYLPLRTRRRNRPTRRIRRRRCRFGRAVARNPRMHPAPGRQARSAAPAHCPGQPQRPAMQPRHGRDQAQAEAEARPRARVLQAHEALDTRSRSASGMPGPRSATVIRTLPRARGRDRHPRLDPSAPYLMALSRRFATACPTSSRLPCTDQVVRDDDGRGAGRAPRPAPRRVPPRPARLRAAIEIRQALAGIAGLEPRDHQQRVEDADEIVALLDHWPRAPRSIRPGDSASAAPRRPCCAGASGAS